MSKETFIQEATGPQHVHIPEPPDADETPAQDEGLSEVEETFEHLRPHDMDDYCRFSRRLGRQHGVRPAYIGYAIIPEYPLGVCH